MVIDNAQFVNNFKLNTNVHIIDIVKWLGETFHIFRADIEKRFVTIPPFPCLTVAAGHVRGRFAIGPRGLSHDYTHSLQTKTTNSKKISTKRSQMAKSEFAVLLLFATCFATSVALKVRKIPPADGGQCGKPDVEDDDGGSSGGETCKGKPGEHVINN